jgi:C1A family cysteine protease
MTNLSSYKLIPLSVLKERKRKNLYQGRKLAISFENPEISMIEKYSLRKEWPEIYDQGEIGSCTANAFCSTFKFLSDNKTFEPSRLYIYWKERIQETQGCITDSGAIIDDACEWANKFGICSENLWPYDVSKVNVPPPKNCDEDALKHQIGSFFNISLNFKLKNTINRCLLNNLPVMMAFGVYESFYNIKGDGICQLPKPYYWYERPDDPNDAFLGGHEVVITGFDNKKRLYEIANSWGKSFGDKGFFYMPYDYIDNSKLVYDFDVISKF